MSAKKRKETVAKKKEVEEHFVVCLADMLRYTGKIVIDQEVRRSNIKKKTNEAGFDDWVKWKEKLELCDSEEEEE